jgi:hypothetical protein
MSAQRVLADNKIANNKSRRIQIINMCGVFQRSKCNKSFLICKLIAKKKRRGSLFAFPKTIYGQSFKMIFLLNTLLPDSIFTK